MSEYLVADLIRVAGLLMAVCGSTATAQTVRDPGLEADAALALRAGGGAASDRELEAVSHLLVARLMSESFLHCVELAVPRLLEIATSDPRADVVADALSILADAPARMYDDVEVAGRVAAALDRAGNTTLSLRLGVRLAECDAARDMLQRALDRADPGRNDPRIVREVLQELPAGRAWAVAHLSRWVSERCSDEPEVSRLLALALLTVDDVEVRERVDVPVSSTLLEIPAWRYWCALRGRCRDSDLPSREDTVSADMLSILGAAAAIRDRGKPIPSTPRVADVARILERAADPGAAVDRVALAAAAVPLTRDCFGPLDRADADLVVTRAWSLLEPRRVRGDHVAASMVAPALERLRDDLRGVETCMQALALWRAAVKLHLACVGRLPDDLGAARAWYVGRFGVDEMQGLSDVDPWGTPFILHVRADATWAIQSAGMDRRSGTGDDLL